MDVGQTALCLVTGSVAEVVKIDHFCAFASTRATAAMAFGIEVFDRFECRLISPASWVLIHGCGCRRGPSLRL